MKRRKFLCLLGAAAGCGPHLRNLEAIPPREVAGGWIREDMRAMANDDAEDIIRNAGLLQWMQTSYRGAGRITVKVYDMKTETNAFGLMQKWQQGPVLAFYKGPVFFTCTATANEAKPLLAGFTRSLQQAVTVS